MLENKQTKNKTVTSLTQDELPADKLPDKTFDMGPKQKDKGKNARTYNCFRNEGMKKKKKHKQNYS